MNQQHEETPPHHPLNPTAVILWLDQGIHSKGQKAWLGTNDRREEKRKMDPPIKSEDDRGWVAEKTGFGWRKLTISMGLHAPRWLNKSF